MSNDEKRDVTDGSGLIAAARAVSGERYLGDWQVIHSLLSEFAAGVLTRYHEVGNGVLTPADASTADQAECMRVAGILVGNDSSYQPVKNWTGAPLADHLRQHMSTQIDGEDSDLNVIAQAIAVFVHSIYDALREDLSTSELMAVVSNNIESLRMTLIGGVGND